MKTFLALLMIGILGVAALPGRADVQLSPERLDTVDKLGYFTPGFKAAVHELVSVHQALEQAKTEKVQMEQSLPDLQKQSADTEAKAAALRQELAKYEHPDETDIVILETIMKDPKAKPSDQLAAAQAYVWSYPGSIHMAEAQQDLQQVQKEIADAVQKEKDDVAAKAAAWASLIQRAQARDLKLSEWNVFLKDMTEEDVVKYIGLPPTRGQDYWLYTGPWTTDPYTGQKVGIEVSFNGTRVIGVSVGPVAQ